MREGIFSRSWRATRRAPGRRWRRDERGSAAIEFAVIAPVFFFLMFVIAETALVFIAEQVMDNAVFETARLIRTGQVANQGMSEQDFKDEVCGRVSIFMDCTGSNFYLDVQSYDEFADMLLTQPVDDDGEFTAPAAFDFGEPNSIVVVRAYYQWPVMKIPFTPVTLASQGLNGKHLIGSFAAFCNEPYQSTSGGCGG